MKEHNNFISWMTRRDLLAQSARGAGLAIVAPYLALAQPLVDEGSPAPRKRESFDFGWKFLAGDAPGAQEPGFGDAHWRDVDLPHDWSIEGKFDEQAPSAGSGAYLPAGIGWYRKSFRAAETDRDKVIVLEFDGVYQNSEVWINGQYLGLRPYGYVPFCYELTPHLHFGELNLVVVRVDNSNQTNCRWYSGSGIYRHTWLLTTDPLRVGYWGTYVTTPQVSPESAVVEIKTRIVNGRTTGSTCTLITEIVDKDGRADGKDEAAQIVGAGAEYEFVQRISLANPDLWSPAHPNLYTVRSTVQEEGRTVDVYETPTFARLCSTLIADSC